MAYKQLFLFLEGEDDKRLFESILKQIFEKTYDYVTIIQYSQQKYEKINNFLRSIKCMRAEYIFTHDFNDSPCITERKRRILEKYKEINEKDKIAIIIKEIESWYLAGLDDKNAQKLTNHTFISTENITKEKFDSYRSNKFDSRIDFMVEILKYFSIETTKQKNNSFRYFADKFLSI